MSFDAIESTGNVYECGVANGCAGVWCENSRTGTQGGECGNDKTANKPG